MKGHDITQKQVEGRQSAPLSLRRKLAIIAKLEGSFSASGIRPEFAALVLALSARGILPAPLSRNPSGELIERLGARLFAIKNPIVDDSTFANSLFENFPETHSTFTFDVDELLNELRDDLLLDPLLPGWVYQTALMSAEDYSQVRNKKSLTPRELARITQWFTPDWITEFLLDSCLDTDEHESTFLDSSCGAGHILVPALARLVRRRTAAGIELPDALAKTLSDDLFGLDIDPHMALLASLSLYLACRDISREAPLPVPHIYSLESYAGSLMLGVPEEIERAGLIRFDGNRLASASLPEGFDRHALNPPYLSHRLLPEELTAFLKQHYQGCHYDLYAAFLELGVRLMKPGGRLALICQQSFLTTSRYEKLRKNLVKRCDIESIAQLGPGSFATRGGEKVNNAIIVLSRPDSNRHHIQCGKIIIYNVTSKASKEKAEKNGLRSTPKTAVDNHDFLERSGMIPGFPLVHSCPEEIARLFEKYSPLADDTLGIVLTNGLFTCDNKRFVRHFSQMKNGSSKGFVPYDKGGGRKWFSTTPYLIEWKDNGQEIRDFRAARGQSRSLPGERFYFQEGITYSYIGTKGFKARLLSPGCVFDIASSALFSDKLDMYYLLGFLNSSLARFILGVLNPTINFQIGDLRRLPLRAPDRSLEGLIAQLAREAVELAREADKLDANSPSYQGSPLKPFSNYSKDGKQATDRAYEKLLAHIQSLNGKESRIQESIDEAIFDLYKISGTTRDIVRRNEWVTSTQTPLVIAPALKKCL